MIFASFSSFATSELTAAVCVILSTCFSGFMAFSIWYMRRSLKEEEKARKVSAWQALLETWGDDSSRKARKYIFNFDLLDKTSIEALSEEELNSIEATLARCNRISYMVNYGLINNEDVLYFIGKSMLKLWEKLTPFVEYRRDQVGENSDGSSPYTYMKFFQDFIDKNQKELQ